jgi:outer membrane lipoprotein-sorting protein
MRRLVPCLSLLLGSLAAALGSGCAQRDSRPAASEEASVEAPAPARPEAAPEAEPEAAPEAAPREAAPSFRTVDLGSFNELIERFAGADTLLLRLEAHPQPQAFQVVHREFQLKRPDRFRAAHDFDGRRGERICDGKTLWLISPARREYVEMPVIPGRGPGLGLLPELFQRARQIATGEDRYAQLLAAAQPAGTETIDDQPCDVVGIKLDQPRGAEAKIWLTQDRRLPLRVRMISVNGVMDYEVQTLEIGVELDDATFTFTPGPDWTGRAIPLPPPATRQPTDERHSEDEPTAPGASPGPSDTLPDDE